MWCLDSVELHSELGWTKAVDFTLGDNLLVDNSVFSPPTVPIAPHQARHQVILA